MAEITLAGPNAVGLNMELSVANISRLTELASSLVLSSMPAFPQLLH